MQCFADLASISSIDYIDLLDLHDAITRAQHGCGPGLAAQAFKCFAEHVKSSTLMAAAPVDVQLDHQLDGLLLASQMRQLGPFEAVPMDPLFCPVSVVQLCTYSRESTLAFLRLGFQFCAA